LNPPKSTHQPRIPEKALHIKSLLDTGLSRSQVAKEARLTPSSITSYVLRYFPEHRIRRTLHNTQKHLRARRRAIERDEVDAAIKRLRQQGWIYREIGQYCGITHQAVEQRIWKRQPELITAQNRKVVMKLHALCTASKKGVWSVPGLAKMTGYSIGDVRGLLVPHPVYSALIDEVKANLAANKLKHREYEQARLNRLNYLSKVEQLLRPGITLNELAAALGVAYSTLCNRLSRYNQIAELAPRVGKIRASLTRRPNLAIPLGAHVTGGLSGKPRLPRWRRRPQKPTGRNSTDR